MGARLARAAIVTGSDSGIGKATAIALAEAGCDVGVTWHRDEDGAEDTAAAVRAAGGKAVVARLDVAALEDAARVIDRLADDLGRLDVLVNNAGTGIGAPFLEVALQDWQQVLDTDPRTVERPGIPLGRPGHAREIASAIAWLASEEAGYATGASFVVDGGLLLVAARHNRERAR